MVGAYCGLLVRIDWFLTHAPSFMSSRDEWLRFVVVIKCNDNAAGNNIQRAISEQFDLYKDSHSRPFHPGEKLGKVLLCDGNDITRNAWRGEPSIYSWRQ